MIRVKDFKSFSLLNNHKHTNTPSPAPRPITPPIAIANPLETPIAPCVDISPITPNHIEPTSTLQADNIPLPQSEETSPTEFPPLQSEPLKEEGQCPSQANLPKAELIGELSEEQMMRYLMETQMQMQWVRHGDVDNMMRLTDKLVLLFQRLRQIKYNNLEQFLMERDNPAPTIQDNRQ